MQNAAEQFIFNGATWLPFLTPSGISIAANAARTATFTSPDQTNRNFRGCNIYVNVVSRAVATTLTPRLDFKDPVSGNYFTVWTGAAINVASGLFCYQLYPTTEPIPVHFSEQHAIVLGATFRIVVTPSDANSITYSVGLTYLL